MIMHYETKQGDPVPDTSEQEKVDNQGVSRRDFLKFCTLTLGGLALPRPYTSMIEQALAAPKLKPNIPKRYFQWQNRFLSKTIYPMREVKLRDFLIYYMEVDIWSNYKDKDINDLTIDVHEYKKAWEENAVAAQKEYSSLRDYFFKEDVREDYSKFQPIDEAELNEINNLHAIFAQSWPKDIRGERYFLQRMIAYWEGHRDVIHNWIKSRYRRQKVMDPAHPKYILEGEELKIKESITLPMAEQEMDQLRAFLATYDKIEKRKLDWYRMQNRGQAPEGMTEEEFLVNYPAEQEVGIHDIARWKIDDYTKSIENKNQYELLDMIYQRFQSEPERFPPWLQYMVVHFSGMRYASAHGSWADPKDLLVRLRAPKIEEEIKALDDATIERLCLEKIAAYESEVGTKPALALATEEEWTQQIGWHLPNVKAYGPRTRRKGLTDLRKTEDAYEIMNKSTEAVLKILRTMKKDLPSWAWKEIVSLTPLRLTEVTSSNWEKLTQQQQEESYSQENYPLRAIINSWKFNNVTAWREEHGRTLELIVSRAVCNEAAEHCQHIRGHQPPGGLAARPKWYLDREGKLPGAYFIKPTSEADYSQGASILWLRFVNFSTSNPTQWQIAKPFETKQQVGLLPAEFTSKKAEDRTWEYKFGEVTTRKRTTIMSDKRKVVEKEWLRWIHEATVAEVAETADGMMVLTFETALPGGDRATSAVGIHKMPLSWHLSDGTEDLYNRSFVGYLPEGDVPVERLDTMLDWNKIFQLEGF